MKKLVLLVVLLLSTMLGHAANDDVIVDGVVYTWYANTTAHEYGYIAAGWDEETPIQSLHILGKVNELDVIGIKANAFEDNLDIEYVKIDKGITSIGHNAFCRCKNLKCVILPEGLQKIEEEAFAFCEALNFMVIPSTVQDIQSHAFSDCTGVTDVYFLMEAEQLEHFNWWDGIHHDAPQEAGGMEFNTNQHTKIHVPNDLLDDYVESGKFTAWLPLSQDEGSYPLWWIVNYGVVNRGYTVSDDLTAVYVDASGDLYAKDDNEWLMPDKIYAGENDYMGNSGFKHASGYDQSNWVALHGLSGLPVDRYIINGGSITGTLKDKRNPLIEVTSQPTIGAEATYEPNVYIAASLMGRTQKSEVNGRTYAFVRPKPQEYAKYEWSIYSAENQFYIPAPSETQNRFELAGGFIANFDLHEYTVPTLEKNAYYPFDAITRLKLMATEAQVLKNGPRRIESDFAPFVDGGISPWFEVFPLNLPTGDPIVTGINDVETNRGDAIIRYIDAMGHCSVQPFKGFNIVVIQQGGQRRVQKVIKQ